MAKACGEFITENLTQYAFDWVEEEIVTEYVFETFCKANMLILTLPLVQMA
jgi:hypothetical protein